jgi:hypothetical protein
MNQAGEHSKGSGVNRDWIDVGVAGEVLGRPVPAAGGSAVALLMIFTEVRVLSATR